MTSVPRVRPINDLKYRMAQALEGALAIYRESGNMDLFEDGVRIARSFYEAEMKPAAHKGYLDWRYMADVGSSLEKVEAIVIKWRSRNALSAQ